MRAGGLDTRCSSTGNACYLAGRQADRSAGCSTTVEKRNRLGLEQQTGANRAQKRESKKKPLLNSRSVEPR